MKMISREDLKQRVMGHFCGSCSMPYKDADILELGEYCCDMISDTIAFIDGLPTIEASPVKHGRWIRHGKPEDYFWNCSECKNWIIYAEHDLHKHHFCGNCGCRMDGDSE